MSRSIFTVLALLALAALAPSAGGCGDLYSDPTDRGAANLPSPTDPSGGIGVLDAAATVPRDFVSTCSSVPAREGTPCSSIGSVCEYGSSPDMRCNTTVACSVVQSGATAWVARPSVLCPSYACPTGDPSAVDGTPCALPSDDGGVPSSNDELVCPMTGATCACTTGPDAAHAHERRWVCTRPTNLCPSARPLAGSSCGSPRSCDYGSCAFKRGLIMECTDGVWTTGSAQCN